MSQTIPEAFRQSVQLNASRTALIFYGRRFSYEELGVYARRYARALMKLGIKKGDRVAIMMTNVPQFVFAYHGALLAGAIVTPINLLSLPRSWRADTAAQAPEDIVAQIRDAKPRILFAFDFFLPLVAQLQSAMGRNDAFTAIFTGPHEFLPVLMKNLYPIKAWSEGRWVDFGEKLSWALRLEDLMREEERSSVSRFSDFPGMRAQEDEVAHLQYTGGTTGVPKGAMLTHKNLMSNLAQANKALDEVLVPGKEVVLGVLPFFHIYGLTAALHMTLLQNRGTLVLVADSQRAKDWLSWIKEYRVTMVPSVPRLYGDPQAGINQPAHGFLNSETRPRRLFRRDETAADNAAAVSSSSVRYRSPSTSRAS